MNHISQFYSPNFDLIKRKKEIIKFLVFHYTGMKNEMSALKRLSNINSKVSCHYFIKKNGTVINLVPDFLNILLLGGCNTSEKPIPSIMARIGEEIIHVNMIRDNPIKTNIA